MKIKNKIEKIFIIISILGLGLLFNGCISLRYTQKNIQKSDAGFWFSLDPTKLLEETNGYIFAPKTGKKEIDPLLTKCEILINSLRKEKAQKLYSEEQIQYEIKMTLAMIDSRDPIKIFQGKTIKLAMPTHQLLLSQRKEILLYQK